MDRPNILLLHSDQHRFDCVGANGHTFLKTPNLDKLAAEGVNFSHAFTPTPICSPERASLLTGLWPTQHGCMSIPSAENYRPADGSLPTFSRCLKETGYRLGYVCKFHEEIVGLPTDHGFDDYIPEYKYWDDRKEKGIECVPWDQGISMWYGAVDPYITPEQSKLAWGADHVMRLMGEYATGDSPFFLRWDPSEPHLANIVPEPYASMYPPESIPAWPSFGDKLENKPYIQEQQRRTWGVDGWTWEQWAPVVGRYLGEVSLIDAQVGRILAELDRLGLSENTLVIYTTDHGDMCGGHGMMDKHFVMYEDVVRVPLIMRWPGVMPAGEVCDDFVSSAIDLASTFCDAAGVEVPAGFMGRSLRSSGSEASADAPQDILSMYHGCQLGLYSQRMVRDRRWKYVYNCTAEDELYDLETDPAELKNLASDPQFGAELSRLRARLIVWMEQVQDPLPNAWNRRHLDS